MVKDGRFGPYVTDGETNASLRSGDDLETITLERALELLAERRARGPGEAHARTDAGTDAEHNRLTSARLRRLYEPTGLGACAP